MSGKPYPRKDYVASMEDMLLLCGRLSDKRIYVPREQPGNIILVHGVNDVGAGYAAVEQGLCAGLEERLLRHFRAGEYRLPTSADKDKVEADPDAVFFRRQVGDRTRSPVIPFYWGYREVAKYSKSANGQKTDRFDTRLDKDLSKGGGPFGNATSSLPDMWNRGVYVAHDPINDPLRPLRSGPGRMYMVLAAMRLACLVSMIRSFSPHDTVNIVAHSQSCLLSLLAQAILMEKGERTADTLILCHPPYGLDDEMSRAMKVMTYFQEGRDSALSDADYARIDGRQKAAARLFTLANIVKGVAEARRDEPVFAQIDESRNDGMVGCEWRPDGDRDNRGRVYLYFSPEDMTVALDNIRGIGWQGVPDYLKCSALTPTMLRGIGQDTRLASMRREMTTYRVLPMLGPGFRQRVFTSRQWIDPRTGKQVVVKVGQPPHDFLLRLPNGGDHDHVAASGRSFRAHLPESRWPIDRNASPVEQRQAMRTINGEALRKPVLAEMHAGEIAPDQIPETSRLAAVPMDERGPCEEVDPITAATAVAASERQAQWHTVPSPGRAINKPSEKQALSPAECTEIEKAWNATHPPKNDDPAEYRKVLRAVRHPSGKVEAEIEESLDDARRRWQHDVGEKSFHSAIFDSSANHRYVTAYDVAIGRGKASSHPEFYAYLCAVADWRLKKPEKGEQSRDGVLKWLDFLRKNGTYYGCEPSWRKRIIEGNSRYYSSGVLPEHLPGLNGPLWNIIISETVAGIRVYPSARSPGES